MPIVSKIGRSSLKTRLLFAGMYVFLLAGAASMIYPFMLMLSGSTKSGVDLKYFEAVPGFLVNDQWLYRKHMEGLFNESVLHENTTYDEDIMDFEVMKIPRAVNADFAEEWAGFIAGAPLPDYAWTAGYLDTPRSRTQPSGLRLFKTHLRSRYGADIQEVNRGLETEFASWNNIVYRPYACLMRRDKPSGSAFTRAINEFTKTLPPEWRYYFSVNGFFKKMYLKSIYSLNIDQYNREHGTKYASWSDVNLAVNIGGIASAREKYDWEDFVRNTLALQWIRADSSALGAYHAYLQARHKSLAKLNGRYGTGYKAFTEIPLVEEPPLAGPVLSDWDNFITGWKDPDTGLMHKAPAEALRIHSVEVMFRDHLRKKYGAIEDLNRRFKTEYRSFTEILPPQRDLHCRWFAAHMGELRWEFVLRNYKTVGQYLLFHGRGIFNTVVYCTLAVLIALLVNPLAAYALSRYKMPATYKVLLFLMATMAFPAMVTQIPSFLMLRQLHLLNTFAALILPGMANGFSIFLLKGFFDSLPRELYESAQLDGAGEWTMFWHLTMSLSKPILAVIALGAFTGAYSNFMFAFVVCQDQKMWTMMVWLYQLQSMSGRGVMYASLIIAAIPTFLIFAFCQNIIMRGIVVPSEK